MSAPEKEVSDNNMPGTRYIIGTIGIAMASQASKSFGGGVGKAKAGFYYPSARYI